MESFKQIRTVSSFIFVLTIGTMLSVHVLASELDQTKTVSIQTPTPCHIVEKIEQPKVYLISATEQCVQMIGLLQITISATYNKVQVYIDGKFWQEQEVETINLGDVSGLLDQSHEIENSLMLPPSRFKKEATEKAETLTQFFSSETYQGRLREETDRLKREVFNLPLEDFPQPEDAGSETGQREYLSQSERIYIFISSAMPIRTLRNYAADLDHLGDPNVSMVMRGFIGGMKHVKPTLDFVSRLIVKDPACRVKEEQCPAHRINLQIDPLLFRKYKIARVPALVYVPSLSSQDQQASEGLDEVPPHTTLYGDASLEYLIETLHRNNKRESLNQMLKSFTGD